MENIDNRIVKTYAESVLRERADRDFLSARILYFYELYDNYIYMISQACEKYLKAILLMNLIPAKDISHDLCKLLSRIEDKLKWIPNMLDNEQKRYFNKLNDMSMNRYDEVYNSLFEDEMQKYDSIIWSIRKYCRFIIYDQITKELFCENPLYKELTEINKFTLNNQPKEYQIHNGFLEKVIRTNKNGNARKYLVANNDYFGDAGQSPIIHDSLFITWSQPFHVMSEDTLSILEKYIKMPIAKKNK